MRILLSLFFILVSFPAFADTYRFLISSDDPGKIVQAENCLAYIHSVPQDTNFSAENGYLLETILELRKDQFLWTLDQCRFDLMDGEVKIVNLTKDEIMSPLHVAEPETFTAQLPNLYLPKLSPEQKEEKLKKVKDKIDLGDKLGAIEAVIQEYGLSTSGYQFSLGGDMGSAGAVTDHSTRKIEVSDAEFKHPCDLIQAIRHELEHAQQWQRAVSCGLMNHHFSNHVQRERMTYLNDLRTVKEYCTDIPKANAIRAFMTDWLLKNYSVNRKDVWQ